MATINELKTLFKAAIRPDVAQFSKADANNSAIEAILETYGLKDATPRQIRARQPEVFAIVEEVVEELLPKAVEDVVGGFVETKTFARDAEPIFEIKNIGKARARRGIVEGARGGIYKARRLDSKNFQVPVKVETVGAFVTLEDILLGTYSLSDLMSNITDGFVERIYINCVKALRTAKTLAPAANIKSANGFEHTSFDQLVRIASAYGTPVIMGFRGAISKMFNGSSWTDAAKNPNTSVEDIQDVRKQGFVAIYKGTPIVELPNYLVDETNSEFIFKEGDIFVLPSDARPVKVAMKGDLHIEENKHPSGSMEQQAHRMIGVGLYLANDICVYTDTSITGGVN